MTAKNILVTGASGFLGRQLVEELVRSGHSVRAATRSSPSFPGAVNVTLIPDLSRPVDWRPFLEGIDIVIHLAGVAHADLKGADLPTFDSVNWIATQNLALAARQSGIERFIFVSSVRAQVGPSATRVVDEEHELHPTDHYGRSKLAAESAVRAAGVPFTILRPVAVYGPHPRGNIRTLLRLAMMPWPLPFQGLTSRRSLLGIDNFISAVLFVLDNPAAAGGTYLVADSAPYTVRDIFTMLRKAQGREAGLFYIPPFLLRLALILADRAQLWQRINGDLVVDTGKLRTLGWRAKVDTYEGVVAMIRAENAPSVP